MTDVIELTKALMEIPSITPKDQGCQAILATHLAAMGFDFHTIPYQETSNFWATRGTNEGPVFVFAGHTDVVPEGPHASWDSPPFEPTVKGDYLYGRGAADMKGSVAAMIVACEQFIEKHPAHLGKIAFMITSAEEGPSEQGTPQILNYLKEQQQSIDYCIVGEPSSTEILGDTLKNGRRGSLTGRLVIQGQQGHIAYPHLADNPIPQSLPALKALYDEAWDNGNAYFQATSFQISNINSGTGAGNVIPGHADVLFNFRYSTETTHDALQQRTREILDQHNINYDIEWTHYGYPFLTQEGTLITACRDAIQTVSHIKPTLSTKGGTSDGRYIAKHCKQVVELGPCNATIHQINECVKLSDLTQLVDVYRLVLENLLLDPS